VRLTHVTKYAAVAGAVVTPLMGFAPASYAGTDGTGSAYALSATGAVVIGPISEVHATSGQALTRKSLAELAPNPVLEASILNAAAAPGYARASVADLKLRQVGLVASLITAECRKGHGRSALVEASLNGRKLAVSAPPNTTISVAPEQAGVGPHIVKVVINKRTHNADKTLTVTALEATVSLGAGKLETVSIASATCGVRPSEATPPSGPAAPSSPPSPGAPGTAPAPAPTPVPGDLPVTG
jgi:hypothetical protein